MELALLLAQPLRKDEYYQRAAIGCMDSNVLFPTGGWAYYYSGIGLQKEYRFVINIKQT
ncbi:MAG: hypothetical protein ACQ9MH_11005 [Nitrospinales bacterium]